MKKKISVKLPNKLHLMLTKALDDVEKIEAGKIKGFDINMGTYGSRCKPKAVCEVCLGGSQLIGKLPKGKFDIDLYGDCSMATCKKLRALDSLRVGSVSDALRCLGKALGHFSNHLDRKTYQYEDNPKIWKAQMRLLAAELEEANL
jgi:hypothetical protein